LSRERKTWDLFTPSTKLAIKETDEILKDVGLIHKKNRTTALLSHGDRKVLEIAMALGGNPEFLILDEPTAGMAAEETARCIDLVKHLSEKLGLTILFCEHDMEIVFGIANRIMVMVRGGTIIQGTCEQVRCDQAVQDAYLGGSDVCLM
jgi:branched-chain amino acid transport system ATP-binding protein